MSRFVLDEREEKILIRKGEAPGGKDRLDLSEVLENAPELFEDRRRYFKKEKVFVRSLRLIFLPFIFGGLVFIPYPLTVSGRAVFVPGEKVDVRAPVSGTVSDVFVREAGKVEKGQGLLMIENDRLDFEKEQTVSEISLKEKKLEEIRLRSAYLEESIREDEKLISKGFLSPVASRRKRMEYALMQEERERGRMDIDRWKARVFFLVSEARKGSVPAPISGTVISDSGAFRGNFVREGDFLLTLASADSVLSFPVRQEELRFVKPGDAARVRVPGFFGEELHGEVDSIKHYGENASRGWRDERIVKVMIRLDPEYSALFKNGTGARVSIDAGWTTVGRKIKEVMES